MNLGHYLGARRAYNMLRQTINPSSRLSFAEFSTLCLLICEEGDVRSCDLSRRQNAARATTTHRIQRLEDSGYIEKHASKLDGLVVVCSITELGEKLAMELLFELADILERTKELGRFSAERTCRLMAAAGELQINNQELVLIGLSGAAHEYVCAMGDAVLSSKARGPKAQDRTVDFNFGPAPIRSVSELVSGLGLIQPTVSMSLRPLQKMDLVIGKGGRPPLYLLSDLGIEAANVLIDAIDAIYFPTQPKVRKQH